jgi:hypothetical protein
MPPVVWGGSSARQTFSPVVSTSMSCAQSSGVTMSCADSSRATPSHARYRARRQRTGERHRAVASRARASAAAPPPPAVARPLPREPSGGPSGVRPLRSRCRSRRLTQPLRQLALRYDGLLLPWDTSAAVPSAGRDAVAREAASTAPAGPYRRYRPSASRPIASDQQSSSRGPSGAGAGLTESDAAIWMSTVASLGGRSRTRARAIGRRPT